jgi:hypothetical protein
MLEKIKCVRLAMYSENTSAFKLANTIANVLNELGVTTKGKPKLLNDNQANIEFVKGNNVVIFSVQPMKMNQWIERKFQHKHHLQMKAW